MFWKDRDRDNKELNGGPLCGQVRVLVVGDSGYFLHHSSLFASAFCDEMPIIFFTQVFFFFCWWLH